MKIEKSDVALAIILNGQNRILLQKKDSSHWWFPKKWCCFGGHLKLNESPKNSLERELKEELNISINNLNLYMVSEYQIIAKDKIRSGKVYVYEGIFSGKISDIRLGEGVGFAFFEPEEIRCLDLIERNRTFIEKYLKERDLIK